MLWEMANKIILFLFIFFIVNTIFAEEKTNENGNSIIPLLTYEYVAFDDLYYHNMGGSLIYTHGDLSPPVDVERNSLVVLGAYNAFLFSENIFNDSALMHRANITLVRKIKSHFIMGSLVSASDKPLYIGGLRTARTGLGYGYEFIRNNHFSLTLGAIAWVGDFGIEMGNGNPLPVLPLPIALFAYTSKWFNASFEFFGEPSLNMTIAPEQKIRLTSVFWMEQYRNINDLFFDITLWYRFFSNEHRLGDFAGLGLGIKNNGTMFVFSEKDKSYELNKYSAYAIVDLSFLQISGGLAFNGREIYDGTLQNKIGNGFFVSAQLAWKF